MLTFINLEKAKPENVAFAHLSFFFFRSFFPSFVRSFSRLFVLSIFLSVSITGTERQTVVLAVKINFTKMHVIQIHM